MPEQSHWSEDTYWTDALEDAAQLRESGTLTLNLKAIEDVIFSDAGPAYRLMHAMVSVKEREGMDGHRGAPRLVLALLVRLKEISDASP